MERKTFWCVFFIILLVSPASILAKTLEEVNKARNISQAQVLLPIASYAGLTVSAPLFAARRHKMRHKDGYTLSLSLSLFKHKTVRHVYL